MKKLKFIVEIFRVAGHYQQLVSSSDNKASINVITSSLSDYILKLSETILVRINQQYLVGATVLGKNTITAWFNNQAFHTAPLSVGLIHNAIIRARMGSDYGIDVINEPMPYTADTRMEMIQLGGSMGFQLAVNVGFAMAFVAAFYVLAYIRVCV